MKKTIRLTFTITTLCISMGLLFNHSVAHEDAEKAEKPAFKAPSSTLEKLLPKQESPEIVKLKETVNQYVQAWHKKDFKAMRLFESWEGGEKLEETQYLQEFDSNFTIQSWRITKITPANNNQYQVLVLIRHNVSKRIAPLVRDGITVRSTIPQWWKKDGDKFVHLFHIERKKLMEGLPTTSQESTPKTPKATPAPKTEPVPKKEEPAPKTPEPNQL